MSGRGGFAEVAATRAWPDTDHDDDLGVTAGASAGWEYMGRYARRPLVMGAGSGLVVDSLVFTLEIVACEGRRRLSSEDLVDPVGVFLVGESR